MGKDRDIDYQQVIRYIIIGIVACLFLWLNYCSFSEHISSNSNFINHYKPKEDALAQYRNPAVAGLFYSNDTATLSSQMDNYLRSSAIVTQNQPQILIVPHAGYQYSAIVAAKAYAQLNNYAKNITKVVLVGPSHKVAFEGIAIPSSDYFKTPLGNVAVDKNTLTQLHQNPNIKVYDKAHKSEHSLEVQLPFLQKVLGSKFSIIPLVYGDTRPEILASILQNFLNDKNTLIVISADLSHYYSYENAKKIDTITEQMIEDTTPNINQHQSCGAIGINAALILAKENHFIPKMLDMLNSGDISKDKSSVVGYGAWSFTSSLKKTQETEIEQEVDNLNLYIKDYGSVLLDIAHNSLEKAVKEHKHLSLPRDKYPQSLFDKGASFVTLHKNGELRGCIGTIIPRHGIAKDIISNTFSAALEDNRFSPVTEEELKAINISISLLTGFERIRYIDEADLLNQLKVNQDGVILRDGDRQGLFLPSVWQELPKKADFLNQLKIKAGMSPSYWSNKIKVYRFRTVEIKDNAD